MSLSHANLVLRLNTELEQANRRLSILYAIDRAAAQSLDPADIMNDVADEMRKVLQVEMVCFFLVEADGRTMTLRVNRGLSGDYIGSVHPIGINEGVSGQAIARKQVVVLDAADCSNARLAPFIACEGLQTLASVPLLSGGRAMGALNVGTRQPRMFSKDELNLLSAIGAQIGSVLEKARLYQIQSDGAQRLELLYRTSQTINSTLEQAAILDLLADEAMRATHAAHAAILVVRQDLGVFERRSLRGWSAELAEQARSRPLPLDHGVNGRVYRTQQEVRVDDVQIDPDYFPLIPDTRSELVVPILRGREVLGNLDLQSPEVGAFRNIDPDYLRALTDQVAIALHNARLYEIERAGRHRLEALYRVGQTINSTLEVGDILDYLTDEAMRATCATHGAVLLARPDLGQFEICSTRGYSPELLTNLRQVRMTLDDGLNGRVYHTRRVVCVEDVQTETDYVFGIPETRSELVVPILHGDQVLGNLDLQSPRVGAFRDVELEYLRALADQGAVALRNARLYKETKNFAARLEEQVEKRTRELRQAYEQLQSAQEELVRKEKLAVLGQLASSIGHELRNPLGGIRNATYYLRSKLGQSEPRIRTMIAILDREVERANHIITDLLDYARSPVGRPLQLGEIDLNEILVEALKRAALPAAIEVSRECDASLPQVKAERTKLEQVFLNLIQNAGQAMPSGGRLTLRTRAAGGGVEASVTDTGDGIPPENLPKIFEPLFSTRTSGTGLGLAVVRKLVELHGGRVSAESQVKQGSTFTVWLPLAPPSVEQEKNGHFRDWERYHD